MTKRGWFDEERWAVPSGKTRVEEQRLKTGSSSLGAHWGRWVGGKGLSSGRFGSIFGGSVRGGGTPAYERRTVYVEVKYTRVGGVHGMSGVAKRVQYIGRGTPGGEEGDHGQLYNAQGRAKPEEVTKPLDGEQRQFRIVLSPEDGHQLDMTDYVRRHMAELERRLGRKLIWVAANHFDTSQPHAHVMLRGVDRDGRQLRLPKDVVQYRMRQWGGQIVTQMLGPRTLEERLSQFTREIGAERVTSLDRELVQRLDAQRVVQPASASRARMLDPHIEPALTARLKTLQAFGFAHRDGQGRWVLVPKLLDALKQKARRVEAHKLMHACVRVAPGRRHLVNDARPEKAVATKLDEGVMGLVRWKGLNDDGQLCAVVETVGGDALLLPVSPRAMDKLKVGTGVAVKRAVDKDAKIAELAANNAGVFDLSKVPEPAQNAYRRRLEQLHKMSADKLVTPAGQGRWAVSPDLLKRLGQMRPQPYWHTLSVLGTKQPLHEQTRYLGHVWLDRVAEAAKGADSPVAEQLRAPLAARAAYLKDKGLSSDTPHLRWKLQDKQGEALARKLAATSLKGHPLSTPRAIQRGKLVSHEARNGERFVAIVGKHSFAVVAETSALRPYLGQHVQLSIGRRGQVQARSLKDQDPQQAHRQQQARRPGRKL